MESGQKNLHPAHNLQQVMCGVHLLAIGIDERVFDKGALLYEKALAYGQDFISSHIVCRSQDADHKSEKIGKTTFYPIYARWKPFFFLSVWSLGRKIMREHSGFWLVSADNPFELGFLAWLLARRSNARLYLQIHTDFMSPWFRRASWKERIRYLLAKFLILRADCIRVVSERIRNSILGKSDFPKEVRLPNITVLPIFTDISKFLDATPDPQVEARFRDYTFKMIAVGRFVDKEKNFSMLIEMMREFVKVCPRALLVLVGDGPDRTSYQLLVTKYKLENNVIIERWRGDLPSFYKTFDLYLMSSNYEGWGRTVIEAMASGLPVVMTDVGLAGEIAKDKENGIIVPVGDKEAFQRAVIALWRDPVERRRLAIAGQGTIESLQNYMPEHYFRLYREDLKSCCFQRK